MAIQSQGFPQISAPMVDRGGNITQAWYKFFISLWTRTGAGQGENSAYVPSNVAITGGIIDNTDIGSVTPATGVFTTLRATSTIVSSNFSGSSSGVNTGNVMLSGQNYLTIANQTVTVNPVNLGTSNVTGTLAAARFPALTGDITTSAGALGTTLATVNSNVGTFTTATITVNAKGLITAASSPGTPVANGTYTVGAKLTGGGVNGTITVAGGIITAIQQAT